MFSIFFFSLISVGVHICETLALLWPGSQTDVLKVYHLLDVGCAGRPYSLIHIVTYPNDKLPFVEVEKNEDLFPFLVIRVKCRYVKKRGNSWNED